MRELPADRFSSTTVTKRFEFRGEVFHTPHRRYSYESHNRLFDVDVRDSDGDKTYHVNCSFDVPPQAMHRAIERHFKL